MDINGGESNISEKHSMLMTNGNALEHLGAVLSGVNFPSLRAVPEPGLSLNLADAYERSHSITFDVLPTESAQIIDLDIKVINTIDGSAVRPSNVTKRGAGFRAEVDPLQPGVYRVRASANAKPATEYGRSLALSISDLFSVF